MPSLAFNFPLKDSSTCLLGSLQPLQGGSLHFLPSVAQKKISGYNFLYSPCQSSFFSFKDILFSQIQLKCVDTSGRKHCSESRAN